jgi:inhibitor of cysteine peptidase
MKKLSIFLVVLLAVAFVIPGCARADAASYFTDESQVIKVEVGDEFTIALASNPTTGYDWEYGSTCSWMQLLDKSYQPDNTGLVGSGGTDLFRFKAEETGTVQLSFTYKRSWESTQLEQKTFTVEVS